MSMPGNKPHILVVDDHKSIRDPLAQYLRKNGYRVSLAENAGQTYNTLRKSQIDLVILDIMMPGENGLDVCNRIRATHDIPTIFLTAVTEEMDKIIGLEIGADDYVTKPFNPRELLARIKGVLRRTQSLPPQYNDLGGGYIEFADWKLSVDGQKLTNNSDPVQIVELSTTEFKLLTVFLSHPKMVLSRDQLLDHVSGRETIPFDRSIDNQVSRLRKKIEKDAKNPELIKTVWGGGYMFTIDVVNL